jgi:hypothetical protein
MTGREPPPDRLGNYRVIRRLGEGGMGVVYLAADPQGHNVAVKALRPGVAAEPNARQRLVREVETMRRVHSPFVAEVIDADVSSEPPYIVTRYVAGRTLEAVVDESGPLVGDPLARLAYGLASALTAVHAAGVVHRDLKPGNVMLASGRPVVIDFGIAQAPDLTRLTMTGMFMGTPGYLAPEVIEGKPSGVACDVHSWGATVAYAATGRPPFGVGSFETIFYRIINGQPDLDRIPPLLAPLVVHALARDPALRPSAADLTARLAALDPASLVPGPAPVVLTRDRGASPGTISDRAAAAGAAGGLAAKAAAGGGAAGLVGVAGGGILAGAAAAAANGGLPGRKNGMFGKNGMFRRKAAPRKNGAGAGPDSGAGRPGTGPAAGGAGGPGAAGAGTAEPGAAQAGAAPSGMAQPGMAQPGVAPPGVTGDGGWNGAASLKGGGNTPVGPVRVADGGGAPGSAAIGGAAAGGAALGGVASRNGAANGQLRGGPVKDGSGKRLTGRGQPGQRGRRGAPGEYDDILPPVQYGSPAGGARGYRGREQAGGGSPVAQPTGAYSGAPSGSAPSGSAGNHGAGNHGASSAYPGGAPSGSAYPAAWSAHPGGAQGTAPPGSAPYGGPGQGVAVAGGAGAPAGVARQGTARPVQGYQGAAVERRTGPLLAVAAVAVLASIAALLPVAGTALALVIMLLLRAVSLTGRGVLTRRATRGVRPSDHLLAAVFFPATLIRALLGMVLLAPVAVVAGGIVAAGTLLISPRHVLAQAIAYGAAAVVVSYGLGPGSASTRQPLSTMFNAIGRTPGTSVLVSLGMTAIALAVIAAAVTHPAFYWPLGQVTTRYSHLAQMPGLLHSARTGFTGLISRRT